MANNKKSRLPEPLATLDEWLSSLPVAVVVMILLALLSAIGTVIPQEHLAQLPMGQTFEQMYEVRYGAATYFEIPLGKVSLQIPTSKNGVIQKFGLTKVYFTPYFLFLLIWLSVSSIICTAKRWKNTQKQWSEPRVMRGIKFFQNNKQAVVLEATGSDAAAKLVADLKAHRYRVKEQEDAGVTCIYADRGFARQWWLVALHVSIIILIGGAIYGKIYGTEGTIAVPDASKKTLTLDFAKGKPAFVQNWVKNVPQQDYLFDQTRFRIDYDKKIQLESMMAGMPDDIKEYYTYFVKDFVSELSIERDGEVVSQEVKVNHPIKHGKLVVYQSSYQQAGYINVTIDGKAKEYRMPPPGSWFVLTEQGPVSPSGVMGQEFSNHAFSFDQIKAGDLYVGGEKTNYLGPLTLLYSADMSTGENLPARMFSPAETFVTMIGDKQVLVQVSQKIDNVSIFSYKLDPGSPVLYFGWILMTLGITFGLYIGLTRVMIRVEKDRVFMLIHSRGGIEVAREHYVRWRGLLKDQGKG